MQIYVVGFKREFRDNPHSEGIDEPQYFKDYTEAERAAIALHATPRKKKYGDEVVCETIEVQ